jgi:hypothetical protein
MFKIIVSYKQNSTLYVEAADSTKRILTSHKISLRLIPEQIIHRHRSEKRNHEKRS